MISNEFKELENLSKEERELALKILSEYSNKGSSDTYTELLISDYEEIPVDIDTFVDDVFTSSSTKQISIEPDSSSSSSSLSILNWLRSDSKVHSYEPVLCVPPILSAAIALLLQTWSIQDLYSLTYDRSIVLDLIEYYKTHNSFPPDISGCQVLSIYSFFLSLC